MILVFTASSFTIPSLVKKKLFRGPVKTTICAILYRTNVTWKDYATYIALISIAMHGTWNQESNASFLVQP